MLIFNRRPERSSMKAVWDKKHTHTHTVEEMCSEIDGGYKFGPTMSQIGCTCRIDLSWTHRHTQAHTHTCMPIKSRIQDAGWAGMYFLMKQEEDAGFFFKKRWWCSWRKCLMKQKRCWFDFRKKVRWEDWHNFVWYKAAVCSLSRELCSKYTA